MKSIQTCFSWRISITYLAVRFLHNQKFKIKKNTPRIYLLVVFSIDKNKNMVLSVFEPIRCVFLKCLSIWKGRCFHEFLDWPAFIITFRYLLFLVISCSCGGNIFVAKSRHTLYNSLRLICIINCMVSPNVLKSRTPQTLFNTIFFFTILNYTEFWTKIL